MAKISPMKAMKTAGVQIRAAAASDLETLSHYTAELLVNWNARATAGDALKVYEQVLKNPAIGIILVAENNSELRGFVYASYNWRAEFSGETLDLVEMYVEQSSRHKGVGRSLLDALISHARQRNIHRITCQVHSGNSAIERALESAGFDPERRTLWGVRL
jgi:GNAT superfamily N-acetyltransferase